MDLPCPRCGEPWGFDCLHEEAEARVALNPRPYEDVFAEVQRDFRTKGCEGLSESYATTCNGQTRGSFRAQATAALMELMPDDFDGVAAMIEDYGL